MSHLRSVVKALSWRALGALDTFALTFLMTGRLHAAVGVVGFEVVTKSILYYGHERAWEGFLGAAFQNLVGGRS